MGDKELADKLIELGVLRPVKSIEEVTVYQLLHDGGWTFIGAASRCLSDWRVAGAVLTECHKRGFLAKVFMLLFTASDDWEPLADPRAIVEAGVEALGGSDG